MESTFVTGIIEGFYGRSWSWEARIAYARFLKANGFGLYIYAPKGDPFLRKRWREDWPEDHVKELGKLGSAYHGHGVAWGIGLSPFEIYLSFDDDARSALTRKVEAINRLDPDVLCVLLDDMKGDVPRLAETQAEVFNRIADLSTARRLILCPTYYSFDPILDKVFGKMPDEYLEQIGNRIDPAVDLFWTGPKVCSTEYPLAHLEDGTERLGRKPFIWDNYPVNDSKNRSKKLFLRPFVNRDPYLAEFSAGHVANPMNQAWLSQIPLWTLAEVYRADSNYDPEDTTSLALHALCSSELAATVQQDLSTFEDIGLEGLDENRKRNLIDRYSGFDSPIAAEVVDWLQGGYAFDPACLTE